MTYWQRFGLVLMSMALFVLLVGILGDSGEEPAKSIGTGLLMIGTLFFLGIPTNAK